MMYSRQSEGTQRVLHHHHQPQQQEHSNTDWASSAVSLATSASETGEFFIGLGSVCSTPETSVSWGIPGVSAGKGSSTANGHSVKSEPDVEHTVNGTTVSLATEKDRLFFSLGQNDERPREKERAQSNGSDSLNIGLKLGRRTYFEDSSGGQAKGSLAPSLSSPPGNSKKPRVLSPSTQIARCQVEGCRADLSGCKDYHRRHKVCEMHSKAPKAIAGGIEQRFCQQCSRFHVLTEFDEGKRSCRRRLAGHNERRRKPHPETHSVFGLRNSVSLHSDISSLSMDSAPFYFLDSKRSNFLHRHRGSSLEADFHPYNDLKRTNPWSIMRRDDSSLACQLQAASMERQSIFSTMSRPTADRLLTLLQNPKTQMAAPNSSTGMNLGGTQFPEGPLGPLGEGLSLSSSSGGVLGSLEPQSRIGSCSQSLSSVSGLSNSSRALSLLSSQSWAPRPPPGAPTTLDLSQTSDSTLEQLVASSSDSSNRGGSRFSHLQLPSAGGSPTSAQHQQFENKQFSLQPGCLDSVGLLTATSNNRSPQNQDGNNILAELGGYDETNSVLALVQAGQDLQALNYSSTTSHQGPETIDLMQTPSVPGSELDSHVFGQYNAHLSLHPFASSIFGSR